MPIASEPRVEVTIDNAQSFGKNRQRANEEFERVYVTHMLKRHGGNVSSAAREGHMDRKHFHDICKKHGITRAKLLGDEE